MLLVGTAPEGGEGCPSSITRSCDRRRSFWIQKRSREVSNGKYPGNADEGRRDRRCGRSIPACCLGTDGEGGARGAEADDRARPRRVRGRVELAEGDPHPAARRL